MAEQTTTLTLTWTHPNRWHDPHTVDLQLRHEEETPLRVRFTKGITETEGISATNSLALYNRDGTFAGVGEPGQPLVLESDTAMLDLAQSRVQDSGAEGKAVTLTLSVRLKQPLAGTIARSMNWGSCHNRAGDGPAAILRIVAQISLDPADGLLAGKWCRVVAHGLRIGQDLVEIIGIVKRELAENLAIRFEDLHAVLLHVSDNIGDPVSSSGRTLVVANPAPRNRLHHASSG